MAAYPTTPAGALDAGGAFVIGGGDFGFGQEYTDNLVRSLFTPPTPTTGNAFTLLEQQLTKLPLDALKGFEGLIPGAPDAFSSVTKAVKTIMDALSDNVRVGVEAALAALQTVVNQIMDIFNGVIVTPINAAVQAVKDWWNQITGKTSKLATTGALPAANISGTVQQSQVAGLPNVVTVQNQINDIFAGNVVTPINAAVQSVKDWWTQIVGKTSALTSGGGIAANKIEGSIPQGSIAGLTSLLSGLNPAAPITQQLGKDNIGDLGAIVDGLVRKLTGYQGSGFSVAQAESALQAQASTTAANAAAIAALQSKQSADSTNGVSVVYPFAGRTDAPSLPADFALTNWNAVAGGTISVASGHAKLVVPNTSPGGVRARYVNAKTKTDFQIITVTMPSAPSNPYFGDKAWNYIYGRMSDNNQDYVFAAIGYNTVRLGYSVNGNEISWGEASYSFSPGNYSLVCGTQGGSRIFQILSNGTLIPNAFYTDTTNVTLMNESHRGGGFGMYQWSSSSFGGTPGTASGATIPGLVDQFTLNDNNIPAVVGSGALMDKTTGSVGGLPLGNNMTPTNWYNRVVRTTSDIIPNQANGTFQVTVDGWYAITVGIKLGSNYGSQAGTLLYWQPPGNSSMSLLRNGHQNYNCNCVSHTFTEYLLAGTVVRGGISLGTGGTISSDAEGASTNFAIALLNRSLA